MHHFSSKIIIFTETAQLYAMQIQLTNRLLLAENTKLQPERYLSGTRKCSSAISDIFYTKEKNAIVCSAYKHSGFHLEPLRAHKTRRHTKCSELGKQTVW